VGANGVVDQGGALGFVADVDGMELGAVAFVADGGGGFFAAALLDVGENYGGAFGGGLAGAGEAYALGGAGYEDDFVCEAVGHGERYSRKQRIKKRQEFNTEGTEDAQRTTEKGKRRRPHPSRRRVKRRGGR
jgi:hypothetical protein